MDCYCKRCGLIILKANKGTEHVEKMELIVEKDESGDVEMVEEWLVVKDMFDFENCAFSRAHKNLPGGLRLLACGGCETGIIGRANPSGEGQDIKMYSYLAKSRVDMK